MEEHMLSATELAKLFGLYSTTDKPNGLLVRYILEDYVKDNNLNVSEYYYAHGHGVMRVYPSIVYQKALSDFVFDLEEGKIYDYVVHGLNRKNKLSYKYKQRKSSTIIPITERRGLYGRE